MVVVRDECPYYSLKLLVKDSISFPLGISLSLEVRKVKWTMQGPNGENDEGLKGFENSLHGNWVCGGEYCHLFRDVVSFGVHGKEYPQMREE